jgi:hypothetical protein
MQHGFQSKALLVESEDENNTIQVMVAAYPTTRLNIQKDLNLQQYRCDNLKYRNTYTVLVLN